MALWDGKLHHKLASVTDTFNSSLMFDARMISQDIRGSIAHVEMLSSIGLLTEDECQTIQHALREILTEVHDGTLLVEGDAEDVHTFVEVELTKRIGSLGKKLHTGRSRNDQVAVDLRLYVLEAVAELQTQLLTWLTVLRDKASEHVDTILPGYTHLQRAQPISLGHYYLAYAEMFLRDYDRLQGWMERSNVNPLGSAALAGTTYPLDRELTSKLLGFKSACANSLDGVSDRDFCLELSSHLSLIMMHLSRMSEEVIQWASAEFAFLSLDDAYSTGSSIMPQKKNPDIAELVRGKTGRVYGNMLTLFTMMKALPLAYNKDMQEDKEAIFDSLDTLKMALDAFVPMIKTAKVNRETMRKAASSGFVNATDCADYLVRKGLPFRDAYRITGDIIADCIDRQLSLEDLDLPTLQEYSAEFQADFLEAIAIENCVSQRSCYGATSPKLVREQVQLLTEKIEALSLDQKMV